MGATSDDRNRSPSSSRRHGTGFLFGEPAHGALSLKGVPVGTELGTDAEGRSIGTLKADVTVGIAPTLGNLTFDAGASVARLTFGTRSRLASEPNVRRKSYTRNIYVLVFLMVLTFARTLAAPGSKCQNRNTRDIGRTERFMTSFS